MLLEHWFSRVLHMCANFLKGPNICGDSSQLRKSVVYPSFALDFARAWPEVFSMIEEIYLYAA